MASYDLVQGRCSQRDAVSLEKIRHDLEISEGHEDRLKVRLGHDKIPCIA